MDIKQFFKLFDKCIVKDEDGIVIYPTDMDELNDIKEIFNSNISNNIYNKDNQYYNYSFKEFIYEGKKYTIDILNDITKVMDEMKSTIMKYRTDITTSLDNKELTFDKFDSYIDDIKSRNINFACISIDADYFKSVNDTYGHQIGDTILKSIAKILINNTRKYDIVGRIGGEEFLIVLKDITCQDAQKKAESIRNQAENSSISTSNGLIKIPTLSLGITFSNGRKYKAEDSALAIRNKIISESDIACYDSKKAGRNKVTIFSDQDHQKNVR